MAKRAPMEWRASGRPRRCRTCFAVGAATVLARGHEESPAEDDHVEHAPHVHHGSSDGLAGHPKKTDEGSLQGKPNKIP